MRYVGSKSRHAKYIIPIITAGLVAGMPYVEPFVGGGNVIAKVKHDIRYGVDKNEYVVELLMAVRDGWIPPEHISEAEYLSIKEDPTRYPKYLVGFVGTQCTFGSKWFDCYAKVGTKGPARNFTREGRDNLLKQRAGLIGTVLHAGDYRTAVPTNTASIVYCDPPYLGTLEYRGAAAFDSTSFWQWCERQAVDGHKVYVSEYEAPAGWTSVWSRETAGFHSWTPTGNTRKRPVEHLFTMGG